MASQKRHAIRRAQVTVRQYLRPVTIAYLRISVAWLNTVTAFGEEVIPLAMMSTYLSKESSYPHRGIDAAAKKKSPAMKLILTRFWTNTIKDFKIYCILQ